METNDNLERVYYSFEDWKKNPTGWGMWGFGYGESVINYELEGKRKIHVLPESEYRKIVNKQEEILADHVKKNLAVYIQKFEERLKAPGDRVKRIEEEIKEVDKILTDKALTFVPVWYDEGKVFANGSVTASPDLGRHVSQDYKNEIAYWYYRIIIKADPICEPRTFIKPEYEGNYTRYIPQVVVLVLYQYRQYLLNLTNFDIDKFTFRDTNPPEGKIHYGLCCTDTDDIFEGLRKYKPTRDEFAMFKDSFHQHPFADYDRLRNELPKLIDEIFDRASNLRPDLQAYFLEQMEKDVVSRLRSHVHEKLNFQKLFKKSLEALQEAEQKRLDEIEDEENQVATDGKPAPIFTTAQSVLTLFYLMKAAKFERDKATDLMFAQFIQNITGKEANTKINDTKILKRWREAANDLMPLNRDDLEIVKSWFEKIGLTEIAEQIGKRKKKRKNNKN